MKPISYLHGEPQIIWEQDEVEQLIINESLEHTVICKFSYGWPNIQDLRRLILKKCELKGECKIRLLCNRHILIQPSLMEDYVHLLSKPIFYVTTKVISYAIRTFKWEPMFDPEEETSMAVAQISFPSFLQMFLEKRPSFLWLGQWANLCKLTWQ